MDIKTFRQQRGCNQATLAALVGLTQSALSEIESGKKPLSAAVAKRIADALGTQDVVLKRGHSVAATKALLADVSKPTDDNVRAMLCDRDGAVIVRKAIAALDTVTRDATVPEAVRTRAKRGLDRLSQQAIKALEAHGIVANDLGRDSFGRKARDPEDIQRDLLGRRKKTATGESR